MNLRLYVVVAACATSSIAHAQEDQQNRAPFQIQRESGIYTTKKDAPTPMKIMPLVQPLQPYGQQPLQPQQPYAQQPMQAQQQPPMKKFIFKGDSPFGRVSPDAMIPVPTGPRTTESAPVPGVDSMDAADPTAAAIESNDLPEAVQDPSKPTAQTSVIFEDKDVAPHPVQLRALNKVTGHATLITVQPGSEEIFGNLTIHAHVCRAAIENSQPDSAALLDISEKKPEDEVAKPLFSGWMYASSPSITGLEHPVYDISVVTCEKPETTAKKD